jgi:hypothetical protein
MVQIARFPSHESGTSTIQSRPRKARIPRNSGRADHSVNDAPMAASASPTAARRSRLSRCTSRYVTAATAAPVNAVRRRSPNDPTVRSTAP